MKIDKWMGSARAIAAVVALMLGALLSGELVWGQQIPQIAGHRSGAAYDVARESVISGKIVQYNAASSQRFRKGRYGE
jgi:hypothetical protein